VGVVLCLASTACATAPVAQDPFVEPGPEEVLLTVQNNDARAATIYAYWNGMKERVGMVSGTKTETFRFRWRQERVQLGYEFIGRRAIPGGTDYVDGNVSRAIDVSRGDHLDLVIQPRG
jgi:hypothetical protein